MIDGRKVMLIVNANILTMEGQNYSNGYILVEGKKISDVGDMELMPPAGAREKVIDAGGGYTARRDLCDLTAIYGDARLVCLFKHRAEDSDYRVVREV